MTRVRKAEDRNRRMREKRIRIVEIVKCVRNTETRRIERRIQIEGKLPTTQAVTAMMKMGLELLFPIPT